MCGIAGYVGKFEPPLLDAMAKRIAHRGPDGQGDWHTKGVGFAHLRLSIIDLSNAASQPMHALGDRYTVTFNGEIYNFKELAEDLSAKGYAFNTNSDTAILAPLYDAYGPDMLNKLSGIFAFAIYDKQKDEVFVVRDHMGIKPLYYTFTERGFAFSSELKGLLEVPELNRNIDEEALFSYITYLWCPGEPTMLKGVRKLLPGHYMLLDVKNPRNSKPVQWYSKPMPQMDTRTGKYQYKHSHTPEKLRELMYEVVGEQLIADVPVGSFLSGGVDSSVIVASMRKHTQDPIETFCMTFKDGSMADEGFSEDMDYAKQVAQQFNVNLNAVEVDNSCLMGLEEMVYSLDEPQADPAPLYVREISKRAREKGLKVLMSGTGGDDVFSGYRRHQAISSLGSVSKVPASLRKMALSIFETGTSNSNLKRRIQKLKYLFDSEMETSLIRGFHYTKPNTLSGLLTGDMQEIYSHRAEDHLEKMVKSSRGHTPLNRALALEWEGFLPDHNLNYTDKLGMLEAIEIRVPFLDPKLLNFAADLPMSQKYSKGITKRILKKAFEEKLPHDVLYRSKAGFGAPIRSWITGEAEGFVKDILFSGKSVARGIFSSSSIDNLFSDTKSGKVDGAYTILSLLVIELWMRQFVDK